MGPNPRKGEKWTRPSADQGDEDEEIEMLTQRWTSEAPAQGTHITRYVDSFDILNFLIIGTVPVVRRVRLKICLCLQELRLDWKRLG